MLKIKFKQNKKSFSVLNFFYCLKCEIKPPSPPQLDLATYSIFLWNRLLLAFHFLFYFILFKLKKKVP